MKALKEYGGMALALFVIGIILVVSVLGFSYGKKSACTAEDTDYAWEGGKCLNESGGTEIDLESINKLEEVETYLDLMVGLIGLAILIYLFIPIIKGAKSMSGGN